MSAVLIDFATREAMRPLPQQPTGRISLEVLANIRSTWHRARYAMLAAKYERDAARLRTLCIGLREPPDLAILKRRLLVAEDVYDAARIALMATTAFDKEGVRWKWKQMEDLFDRRSEWEYALAVDEARLGMSEDRPKIELPPASDATGPAPFTASVLDRLGHMLSEIRDAMQPGGPYAS